MSARDNFTAAPLLPSAAGPALALEPSSSRPVVPATPAAPTAEVVVITRDSRAELEHSLPAILEAAQAAEPRCCSSTSGRTMERSRTRLATPRGAGLADRSRGPIDALAAAAACSKPTCWSCSPTLEPASPDSLAD